jgi:hypothetical protein
MSWCSALLLLLSMQEEPPERAAVRARLQRVIVSETDRGGVNPEFEKWKRSWLDKKDLPPKEEPVSKEKQREPRVGLPLGSSCLYVMLIVLGAAAIAVAIYAFTVWRREPPEEAVMPAAAAKEEAAPLDALRKSPEAWLDDARRFVAQGDYRQAIRCLMLAMLNALHRARQIDYEKWKTNRECLATYRGPKRGPFTSLIGLFELAWYGGRPVGAGEYQKAEEMARALRQGVTVE